MVDGCCVHNLSIPILLMLYLQTPPSSWTPPPSYFIAHTNNTIAQHTAYCIMLPPPRSPFIAYCNKCHTQILAMAIYRVKIIKATREWAQCAAQPKRAASSTSAPLLKLPTTARILTSLPLRAHAAPTQRTHLLIALDAKHILAIAISCKGKDGHSHDEQRGHPPHY